MIDINEAVFRIDPIDSPFIPRFSPALRTVILFSGNDQRVVSWAHKIKTRSSPDNPSLWITDKLHPLQTGCNDGLR